MSIGTWRGWAAILAVMAAIGAAPSPSAIHISGLDVKPSDWTVEQLQTQLAAEIKPVEYKSKGAEHTFSCVPLVSVLEAAGIQTDFAMKGGANPKLKNPQMRQAVIVSGRDGYTVVFSMAEVLPMVGNRAIWVALQEDGKPLSPSDGPIRLIVPEDKMPARGVHQVATIDVVQLSAPTTQPVNP
jgi:hypothetical protein